MFINKTEVKKKKVKEETWDCVNYFSETDDDSLGKTC